MYELKLSEGYVRCIGKAIRGTRELFVPETKIPDPQQIHAVKSILYAAIERSWIESERILGVQRMLRELLLLTAVRSDSNPDDHDQAIRILDRLSSISNLRSEI